MAVRRRTLKMKGELVAFIVGGTVATTFSHGPFSDRLPLARKEGGLRTYRMVREVEGGRGRGFRAGHDSRRRHLHAGFGTVGEPPQGIVHRVELPHLDSGTSCYEHGVMSAAGVLPTPASG